MLADPRAGRAVDQLCRSVAVPAQPAKARSPTRGCFPTSTTTCDRRFAGRRSSSSRASLREDRSVLDLSTADYTFLNERLAQHYGMPNVYGSRFRRVTLADGSPRRPARPGKHPHGRLVRQSHVAGASRQVDPREHPRRAAAAAAAERAGLKEKKVAGKVPADARADGGAPSNPVCCELPHADGPARLRHSRISTPSAGGATRDESGAPIDASARCPTAPSSTGSAGLREAVLDRPELFVAA